MIFYKIGNLLDTKDRFIIHQVNCQGRMNSGIAKQISEKYPKVYKEYYKLCTSSKNKNIDLLGKYQMVFDEIEPKCIVNVFGQKYYGNDGKQYTDYNALHKALSILNNDLYSYTNHYKTYVSMPKIGCGLGGGDWVVVNDIIQDTLTNCDVTVWTLPERED